MTGHHIGTVLEFETTQLLFSQAQLSTGKIDQLLHLWALSLTPHQDTSPFADHTNLYKTIDATPTGDVPWESFRLKYSSKKPSEDSYDVWFWDPQVIIKNILSNTDFNAEIDYALYCEFSADSHSQSEWAWEQADEIVKEPQADGATFNDYWPIYLSIGNVHNHVWHAHCTMPLLECSQQKHSDDALFHKFKKQNFHTGMMTPDVLHCPDGHFHCITYGLGPYIADYPEQVLLACIVQNWYNLDGGGVPHSHSLADVLKCVFSLVELWDEWGMDVEIEVQTSIYLLLAPDILHQLIKGTFKDHLVEWVMKYLEQTHRKAGAKEILADIDQHIAVGQGFSQWIGNDSKALMKVYLPAIEGHVLDNIIHTFQAFLEFCYLVQRDAITDEISSGMPNGLCTSITESKHIKAVKEPWRIEMDPEHDQFDNVNDPGITDERLETIYSIVKLAQVPARNCATKVLSLADELGVPAFPNLLQEFLSHQLNTLDTKLQCLATPTGHIKVFHSASVMFVSPTTPSWYGGPEHYDTVFVNTDNTHDGMEGMNVAQVLCFFLLPCTNDLSYLCALIHWFDYIADMPNKLTGMWMVKPSFLDNRTHDLAVVHINTIIQAAHLNPIFGWDFNNLLDVYCGFYINHFMDHHAFELSFSCHYLV
ncbi:hypothetical protein F5J12DRAFT_906210 [Pisolithus orientalis]|uniref:uncharacterized protein n=1 Tax=Pisolithus orientalis TaxID=936130 RepID=UPI0022240DAF|nr:uncharacterized protein F5J12DRAFT_906210 [Pisolithus orientalis]KAI6003231.1 hypothetical protein F5J12DRAFT_906210 [Pisolithus orientalis]